MKIEKFEKLFTSLHDKTEYVIHIRNLEHALNHGLVLKKYIELLNFIKKDWLKPYIKHGSKKKQKTKSFKKYFFKLMNSAVFGKTVENVTKQR